MAHKELLLDNQLCFRLYTASRLITQAYQPLLKSLGLTYPQYLVMLVLWEHDEQPVNDIAKRLKLNTNTVTPLLKRMEDEGVLTRTKGRTDLRQVIVSLTAKGKAMEQQAQCIPNDLVNSFACSKLLLDSSESLAAIMDEIIASLSENETA